MACVQCGAFPRGGRAPVLGRRIHFIMGKEEKEKIRMFLNMLSFPLASIGFPPPPPSFISVREIILILSLSLSPSFFPSLYNLYLKYEKKYKNVIYTHFFFLKKKENNNNNNKIVAGRTEEKRKKSQLEKIALMFMILSYAQKYKKTQKKSYTRKNSQGGEVGKG